MNFNKNVCFQAGQAARMPPPRGRGGDPPRRFTPLHIRNNKKGFQKIFFKTKKITLTLDSNDKI